MSRCHACLLFALVALAPASALAAGDCPDGWFCEDAPPPDAPRPGGSPAAQAPARPSEPPGSPPPSAPPRPGGGPAYNPPSYPPPGYPRADGEADEPIELSAPEPEPVLPRRHRRWSREWGFNLHVEDAIMGNRAARAENAGMAGLGVGFRYRPLPALAFEAGLDVLTGTDYQGYSRTEGGLLLNALVFFNPHDLVQIYGLGGIDFSGATVTIAPRVGDANFNSHDEHYSYFGGQAGFGVEVRVTRHAAISGDLIGFIRERTDDRADSVPEFVDPTTHRSTNSSGGGLVRLGATFYW